MSKSLPMLSSLAGGSGVAAHALTDNDLVHVVDAVTLDADRDRKVALGELRTFVLGTAPSDVTALGVRVTTLEATVSATKQFTGTVLVSNPVTDYDVDLSTISLPVGTKWIVDGYIKYRPTSVGDSVTSIRASFLIPGTTTPYGDLYGPPAPASTDIRCLVIPRHVIHNTTATAHVVRIRMSLTGSAAGTIEPTLDFTATKIS